MKRSKVLALLIILSILLSGCGKKDLAEQIKGDWKVEVNGMTTIIFSFYDRKIEMYTVPDERTQKLDYNISTNTDEDANAFILKVIDRDIDVQEKALEGIFKNAKAIELTYLAGVPSEVMEEDVVMKRIKNVAKEKDQAADAYEKHMAKLEKEAKKAAQKEQQAYEKQAAKEEKKQPDNKVHKENELEHQEQQKTQPPKREVQAETKEPSTLKEKYEVKSQQLENEIMTEYLEIDPYAQDLDLKFYGQYFTEWDDLLQEVWEVLREEMPTEAFEVLKAEQIEWIHAKEEAYSGDPGSAGGRAEQEGEVTLHTQSRVNELIANYLE